MPPIIPKFISYITKVLKTLFFQKLGPTSHRCSAFFSLNNNTKKKKNIC